MMNPKLKRFTAAGLVAVLLLVGFVAEYAHRHAMPSAGPAEFAQGDDSSSGQINLQRNADFCFVCQAHSFAVNASLGFSSFIFNAEQNLVNLDEFVLASLATPLYFPSSRPSCFPCLISLQMSAF
jgi:hypothetical protein